MSRARLTPAAVLAVVLVLSASATTLAQPTVTVAGHAVDASGGAIAGATVTMNRDGASVGTATTDASGRFSVAGLVPGRHAVTVTAQGFAPTTYDVTADTGTVDVTVILPVAGVAERLEVVATRYRPATASTGTKLELPVLLVPQSVSTVTRGVIEDRVLVRLSDIADNVAGVRPLTAYTGTRSNTYQFRGFSPSLTYTNLRNGFQEYSFLSQRDVANIDRVEFLKGPTSLLYGANEVGGTVNTLTKQPLAVARRELGLTFGSFAYARPTLDITGPANASGTLRYRLNAAYDRGDSYRDLVNHENTFVAPHLVWQPTPRTSLGVEVEAGRFENDFDRGHPLAPEFLTESVDKNYGEPWSRAENRQVNTMVNVSHQVNDRWRIRSGFNYIRSETETDAAGLAFTPVAADRRTINRQNFTTHEASRNYSSQNELSGRFRTGALDHQLVTGAELTYYQFKYTFNFRTLASIDRINPVYGAQPGFALFGFNDDSFSRQVGFFAQDHIGLPGGRAFVLLGGRYSAVASTTRDALTGREKNSQDDRAFTPRAGLVYQLTPSTSSYVSFASSFQPNFFSRAQSGAAFDPTTGAQFELGVKQSLANDRVLATVAFFNLTKRDIVVPDPNDPTFSFSIQVGEQRSRGVEVEALAPRRGVHPCAVLKVVARCRQRDDPETMSPRRPSSSRSPALRTEGSVACAPPVSATYVRTHTVLLGPSASPRPSRRYETRNDHRCLPDCTAGRRTFQRRCPVARRVRTFLFVVAVAGWGSTARLHTLTQPPAAPGQTATSLDAQRAEAPTGFDNQTNGVVDQTEFDRVRAVFESVEAPEDGLGPVFNARGCAECHISPVTGGVSQIAEVRAGRLLGGTFVEHPGGSLVQDRALDVGIQERVLPGHPIRTLRQTISILGDGFVEAVTTDALADVARRQPPAMRGLIIAVPVLEADGVVRSGRFGWKNQHASLISFAADAYRNEMGITSPLQPTENTSNGRPVDAFDAVADPEDTGEDVEAFAAFMRATKAPPRDAALATTPDAVAGSTVFDGLGCSVCHTRALPTAPPGTAINGGRFVVPPALGNKTIRPFGDFLLHDIGTGDGIEQDTGPRARNLIRTAPLWGLRTRTRLMHDGLSRNPDDAIARHGGQAAPVTEAFRGLSQDRRRQLRAFLASL